MEALLVREGNNHIYRSPSLIVSLCIYQIATILTLNMGGFSTTISFGKQVQKGTSNKVDNYCLQGKMLYHIGKLYITTSE
jgi:hypothetical protein